MIFIKWLLQTTYLKVWKCLDLHSEVSECKFYLLKFEGVFILHFKVSIFGIPLKFGADWILHLEILKFEFYPLKFYSICIGNFSIHIFC